ECVRVDCIVEPLVEVLEGRQPNPSVPADQHRLVAGQTASTEAHAGAQEAAADARVEPHPGGDLGDVGADLFADVRDLVDEGDLGREKGVRGELDHLGRSDVCSYHGT